MVYHWPFCKSHFLLLRGSYQLQETAIITARLRGGGRAAIKGEVCVISATKTLAPSELTQTVNLLSKHSVSSIRVQWYAEATAHRQPGSLRELLKRPQKGHWGDLMSLQAA